VLSKEAANADFIVFGSCDRLESLGQKKIIVVHFNAAVEHRTQFKNE
jgi:hypothetical protein